MTGRVLLAGVLVLGAAGCRGKALGRAELRGAGTSEVTLKVGAEQPVLWADLDGKWLGNKRRQMPVHYEIDVLSGGKPLGHISCDTSSVQTAVCGTSMTIGNTRSADCEVKLSCSLPRLPAGSEVTLRVTGTPGAGIEKLIDMSLVVRDP